MKRLVNTDFLFLKPNGFLNTILVLYAKLDNSFYSHGYENFNNTFKLLDLDFKLSNRILSLEVQNISKPFIAQDSLLFKLY